ncbi:MAG: ribosome-binding factor A, partial [Sedimenticola sp.]|nr:ribosome-binding factor A [Sedimenticola sp.]
MAREFKRADRVSAQVQRELAELVRTSFDVRKLGMVTIQAVQVARDFSHAKVF